MKKKVFGFLVLIGVVVVIVWGVAQKAYPVATVDDDFIPARQFQLAATAAQTYYQKISEVYGEVSSTSDAILIAETRAAALQALIEDVVIARELVRTRGEQGLDTEVSARVASALASSSMVTDESVGALFGLTVEQFKEIVLEPQARFEMLADTFTKKGEAIESWLQSELRRSRVSVLISDVAWTGDHVELTGEQSYTAKVKEAFQLVASSTASSSVR